MRGGLGCATILPIMCGRYRLSRAKQFIAEHFDIADEVEWSPRYNIAPAQRVAVVRMRQRKHRVDGLELWVLGSPGGGRQFCDALDGNIGEAGKDSSQVVACR